QEFLETDIAIIGGGFGGVAAALAAAEAGKRVVISEPTDWIGGQVTAQAVSALDEHFHIETFGGTRSYYRFREAVRNYYRNEYPAARDRGEPFNPGGGWVSRLCFEPRVGLKVLQDMLAPYVETGRVRLLLEHAPISAEVRGGRISEVTLAGPEDRRVILRAALFLDATELGDLLPLVGAPYVTGAEWAANTGEPHAAPDRAYPERVQSFTVGFLVDYCPGENHTIRKPNGYDYLRQSQPFTLVLRTRGGNYRRFFMFKGDLPFWTYRRVLDAGQMLPGAFASPRESGCGPVRDIALINWDSNDYYKENLIDRSPAQQARILREARRLSLCFLYWLQTEAPRDDNDGRGYPGLRLLPEAVGTADGLAKTPYIRESRRVLGFRRVLEQDITARTDAGARAAHFTDTVGVGWYPIDRHRCAGDPPAGQDTRIDVDPTLPFQIPLGAMLSPAVDNLIAAAKNISTTHITNGAYRVHPVEWAVGEAAGTLAAACLSDAVTPRAVLEDPARLRAFQRALLDRGAPLVWSVDAGLDDPDFAALQASLLHGPFPAGTPRRERLEILPDALLTRSEGVWLLEGLPRTRLPSRARENGPLADLLAAWRAAPLGPFTGADWSAACAALDLPAPLTG
ncbi:MAG TPA: FAD-dependent oxidoreductase, partial [Candidatus Limnocylindria bacterium]|nr:FAD-dependent oxidoreductase [Candidatus Limnocylindria bacterium]